MAIIAAAQQACRAEDGDCRIATPQFALNEPLTDTQVAQVCAVAEGWVQAGLSTQRCDRARAGEAVRQVYRMAGLGEPRQIVWMDSPLGGLFAVALMMNAAVMQGQPTDLLGHRLRPQPTEQLRDELASQLGPDLFRWLSFQLSGLIPGRSGRDRVKDLDDPEGILVQDIRDWLREWMQHTVRRSSVELSGLIAGGTGPDGIENPDELERNSLDDIRVWLWGRMKQDLRDPEGVVDELGDDLRDRVWCQLEAQLAEQLVDQLDRQLDDPLKGQLGDGFWTKVFGEELSLWQDWNELATLSCAFPLAGLKNSLLLDSLCEAFRAMGWWWPLPDAAVLTDRPTVMRRDRDGRLHAENGPALAYADGYRLYAWHGIRVPADLVEYGWSVQQVMAERDCEIRLCAIERMGWDEFVRDARLTEVDQCPDPANPGRRLLLYDIPSTVLYCPVRVLICTNATAERGGTRHAFGLMVPTDCTTAPSAAAWTSTSARPNTSSSSALSD